MDNSFELRVLDVQTNPNRLVEPGVKILNPIFQCKYPAFELGPWGALRRTHSSTVMGSNCPFTDNKPGSFTPGEAAMDVPQLVEAEV